LLGVWEGNYKAIGFYAKMDLSYLTNIHISDDIQTDFAVGSGIIKTASITDNFHCR
jgi:hypothetical protein